MTTAARIRAPRSTGRCALCRGPIKTWHRVTRVGGKGWCHSSCASARPKASTP
jgi:hypothetical protein